MATVYLTPADQGRALTLEQLESADSLEGYQYELIDGKLEVAALPNLPHDHLRAWMHRKLFAFGQLYPALISQVLTPARVLVPGRRATTAPEPDLAAYRDYPYDLAVAELRWQDIQPFLVVEIISADTATKDLVRNCDLYLQVPSIREYWILDPRRNADQPTLTVYRRRGQQWQRPIHVAAGATYTTRLLQGFVLVLDAHR
jgi:Uma2 family endonuclease